jgi:hypothetical protein
VREKFVGKNYETSFKKKKNYQQKISNNNFTMITENQHLELMKLIEALYLEFEFPLLFFSAKLN